MRLLAVLFLTVIWVIQSNASILNLGFERNGDKRGVNSQIKSLYYSFNKLNITAEESIDGKITKTVCTISSKLLADNGIDLVSFMKLASEKESNTRIMCLGKVDLNYQQYIDINGILVVADRLEILIGE